MTTDSHTDTDEMRALALRTAQGIERKAAACDLLREHEYSTLADLDPDDVAEVLAARDALDDLPGLPCTCGDRAPGVVHYPGCERFDTDVFDGVEEWLDNHRAWGALSIDRTGTNSGDGWTTDAVVIVVTTGGPHVQIVYRGDSASVEAWGWFGKGRCSLPVDADAVDLLFGVDDLYRFGDDD